MGDHTDYAGGLCLPMAVDLLTEVRLAEDGSRAVSLMSDRQPRPATVPLDGHAPRSRGWARYVEGVVSEVAPSRGCSGTVISAIPPGAGLASSAALEVALALALGFKGSPLELAEACRRAEHAAAGVPCGPMDQLSSVSGREGCALLIDAARLSVSPVRIPEGVGVVAVHSGISRSLSESAYAERRQQCEAASELIGPLPERSAGDVAEIRDPLLRRRARHVASECARVRAMAEALESADLHAVGEIMDESHQSLTRDCEVSTLELDRLVSLISSLPGVIGARLTGAGFGGCVVVLEEHGALARARLPHRRWAVRPHGGACVAPGS
jgi:galactokinase